MDIAVVGNQSFQAFAEELSARAPGLKTRHIPVAHLADVDSIVRSARRAPLLLLQSAILSEALLSELIKQLLALEKKIFLVQPYEVDTKGSREIMRVLKVTGVAYEFADDFDLLWNKLIPHLPKRWGTQRSAPRRRSLVSSFPVASIEGIDLPGEAADDDDGELDITPLKGVLASDPDEPTETIEKDDAPLPDQERVQPRKTIRYRGQSFRLRLRIAALMRILVRANGAIVTRQVLCSQLNLPLRGATLAQHCKELQSDLNKGKPPLGMMAEFIPEIGCRISVDE